MLTHLIFPKQKSNNAFTLIEILIVITIIAVLSMIVLTAINPIEQINHSRDTATLQDSSQLYSALIRQLVMRQRSPWVENFQAEPLDSQRGQSIINQLVENKELKNSYLHKNSLGKIYLTTQNTSDFIICFLPKSKNFAQHTVFGYFNQLGEKITDCDQQQCYVCINGDNIAQLPDEDQEIQPSASPSPSLVPSPTIEPQLAAWYATDVIKRIDVQLPDMNMGLDWWYQIKVYDESGQDLGFMKDYHETTPLCPTECNQYYPGDSSWPHSYYRFHGTKQQFRQRGLPRYVKFKVINTQGDSSLQGFTNVVDLGSL